MTLQLFRTVRRKLYGVVLLTTFVALTVALGAIVAYDLRAYHQNLMNDMTTQSELLGQMTTAALTFDDKQLAAQNLGLLRFRPNVRAAAIYDAHGRIFATYDSAREPNSMLPQRLEADGVRTDGLNLILFKGIVSDGEVLGTIYLRADYDFASRVMDYAGIAAIVMVFAMLIAYLLSVRLQRIVAGPILAIAGIAREVAEKRDYSRRAEKISDDEVGVLVDSFNAMLAEIERRTHDVAERTLALNQSELRFRQMAENIHVVFFLFDPNSNCILYVSPAYEEIWGRSCESLYANQKSWADAIHPDDRALAHERYKEGLSAGKFEYECRIARPDNSMRWVAIRGFPVRDDAGKIIRIAGVAEDITERKQAAQELRESERRFSDLLENVELVSVMLNRDAQITYCNDYLLRLTGWQREEVIGRNWFEFFIPSDIQHAKDGFAALIAGVTEERHRESDILTRSGERRLIRWNNSVLRSRLGDVVGTASIGEDITEQKRAEMEILNLNANLERRVIDRTADLERARNDANTANQAKSRFLAAMSHEIRTPMNGVIGMADMLHQTSLKGYQVEMVDLIRESAFSLLTIIDDILDFSKIEAGRLEIEYGPMSLSGVVENACSMLDYLADKRGVELTLFLDPAIPPALLGDALRLRQVLLNLVNNAIKFSGGREQLGRVSVRAILAERGAEHAVVDIAVSDNGIGITEETQTRLFTAFTQEDASTTRRFGGTGLGLVISRHLVELMGGKFTLQSVPDQGATFTVRLSFAIPTTVPGGGEAPSKIAGLSCLVVGEPGGFAEIIVAYLTYEKVTVARAKDLAAARSLIHTLAPGQWIWIIDAPRAPPSLDALRAAARIHAKSQHEARFVVIGRGKCRVPIAKDYDLIAVDGNVLSRGALLNAVAIAAGRARVEEQTYRQGKHETEFNPPSREEAQQQGRLILVAEDNETNQKVILRQLALLGFACDITGNGRQALKRWQSGDYALLLSDLHMPDMDGYELAIRIRSEESSARRIPIVALTANALKGEADRCRAAGMDDYLSKPARLEELKAMLERWLPAAISGPGAVVTRNRTIPVDVSVLKALVGNDPEVIRDFLREFKTSATRIAKALKDASANGQPAEVGTQAHNLKSSSRAMGALTLGDLCAKMETAGKAGSTETLAALLPTFELELGAAMASLDSLLADRANYRDDI